ncbi:MAG: caspase family protein [Ignavibacteriae bacterium]|nr:caspase family protein [Ignavibacteriota bacterium]
MKNFIKCLLILFSVLFFNNSSFSQQDKGIIESQNNNNFKNKRWAIVIGISKYKTYSNLQYAHSDAISFYNYLISPIGGSIDTNRAFLLLDSKVQFGEINKILSNLSNKVQKDDEIIFYFSGHGAAENNASIGYLLCYNTEGSNLGFNDCYPISSLRNWCLNYSKLGCKVIVILDACRSGNNNLGD